MHQRFHPRLRVWFHYNARREDWGPLDKWLIHIGDTKVPCEEIHCQLPSISRRREEQPRLVMEVYANMISVTKDGKAIIA